MGLFTSKAVEWRRKVKADPLSQAEYNQLVQTIGKNSTKEFLELVYDKWVVRNKSPIGILTFDFVADFMRWEREAYVRRKLYVDALVPQAVSGALGTQLNTNLRAVNTYYTSPQAPGLAGRDLAIDQAANWICGTYTAGLPAARDLLRRYCPATTGAGGPLGHALGFDSSGLRKMYKRMIAGQQIEPYRIVVSQPTRYPSTVGGGLLLDYIIRSTGSTPWPAFGSPHWESIAMFYLASIVHVQGFTDANKRAGHAAYAIVLINGTHTFKAPDTALEGTLFAMNA